MNKLDELKQAVTDKCVFSWRNVKWLIERIEELEDELGCAGQKFQVIAAELDDSRRRVEELERREANSLMAGDPMELKSKLQRYRELAEMMLAFEDYAMDSVEYNATIDCIKIKARELLKEDS